MTKFEFDAFLVEFPFLKTILKSRALRLAYAKSTGDYIFPPGVLFSNIESMRVSRISPELLRNTVQFGEDMWEVIYCVGEGGKILAHFAGLEYSQVSIGELISANVRQETLYIVCMADQQSSWVITVYKPPKNFTVKQWIEKQIAGSRKSIQRKLAAIDKGAK
jgi:hypothetical protein